jgi:hypothetical protein
MGYTDRNTVRRTGRAYRLTAAAELSLSEADWPRLRRVLAEIAARDGWTLRDCAHPKSLGGSLTRPDGAHVAYKQWTWTSPPEPAVTLYVVGPEDGEGWRATVEALLARLADEWPASLAVKGAA